VLASRKLIDLCGVTAPKKQVLGDALQLAEPFDAVPLELRTLWA
jgi:hypothetical protein